MILEKHSTIIFDDKEDIPLKIQIEHANTKQYLPQPITIEKVDLARFISDNQKYQLQKKINEIKNFVEIAGQPLDETRIIVQQIDIFLPDLVFGPKSLETNVGQFEFNKLISTKNNQEEKNNNNNPGSNVSILIYKGETYESLNMQLRKYNNEQIKIVPIVLINGKTAFKTLMLSNKGLFQDFYQTQYLPFHQKFMSSNNHSLYFQTNEQREQINYKEYYFVFAQELNNLDLIKWIYQGILKFIQPNFVQITSSNEYFINNINILQLFRILESNIKYFGIQTLKKINQEKNVKFNYFRDFTDIALNLDTMFKIKQFHDPLSCIYKWGRIENAVEKYINNLVNKQSFHIWVGGYNAILPKIMFDDQNLELKIITKYISEQKFHSNKSETAYNQFCEFNQNINYQLRKCRFHYHKNVFQWFISKILFLQNYFSISICFFFSFQCPYQIVYTFSEQSVGYTAIAAVIPIIYGINVVLFLLLTQLYHLKDKIIEKNQNTTISVMGRLNNQSQNFEFQTYADSPQVNIYQLQQQQQKYDINFEVQEDEYIKNVNYKITNEILESKNEEVILKCQHPKLKYISDIIKWLIKIQRFVDFCVVVTIVANIVFIHGRIALDQESQQERILIILAFIMIFFHIITKRCGVYLMICNFSFLSYFWQFLQPPKNISVASRIQQKRQLGTQLLLNFILYYTFISIESYFNYSGNILIGILAYLSTIYLILGFFSFIEYFCCYYDYFIPTEQQAPWRNEQQNGRDLILQNDIQDIIVQQARTLIEFQNKKQNQQQFLQSKKINNNINQTNLNELAETIMKINNDIQVNKHQNKKVDQLCQKINEAIQDFNNQHQQQDEQQIKKEANGDENENTQNNQQSQIQQQRKQKRKQSEIPKQSSNLFIYSNGNLQSQIDQNQNQQSQFHQKGSQVPQNEE